MMRSLLAWLAVPLLVSEAAAWKTSDPAALKKVLGKGDYNLIAFIVPETQACELFRPEWEAVLKSDVPTLAVDCGVNRELCGTLDVVSFPTIRLYHGDGRVVRYRGERKAAAILSFVRRILAPPVVTVEAKDVKAYSASDDFVFIATVPLDDENLSSRFQKLGAKYHDQYAFAITRPSSTETATEIRCYNNVEDTQYLVGDLLLPTGMEDLIVECTTALIPQLTEENESRYLVGGQSMLYYVNESEEERTAFARAMHDIALHHTFLKFVTVDPNSYAALPAKVGIAGKKGLAIKNLYSYHVYVYDGKVDADSVNAYVEAVIKNEAPVWDGTFPEESQGGAEETSAAAGDEKDGAGKREDKDSEGHDEL